MADWLDFADGAISSAVSVLGIPWQQNLQKDLMHENEAINIAQWNRENKYNSPKEQMKRLQEAGLNPDLVYGGNVANTAGSAQVTAGTPQAPGAASAVGQAVRNAQSSAMIDSEIAKNESEASRNNAQAKEFDINALFKNRTLDLSIQKLTADLGFTKQQTMESIARTNMFDMQVEHLITDIQNLHSQIRLTNAKVLGQYQLNRGYAFDADLAFKNLQNYEKYFNANLENLFADIGVKKSVAANYMANTSLIWRTMDSQVSYWSNLSDKIAAEEEFLNAGIGFRDAQTNMLIEQLKYLPYQNAQLLMYAEKYFDKDDKGNYIYLDNGLPKIREASAVYGRITDQVGAGFNILGEAASTIFGFGVGAMGFKGAFKGLSAVKGTGKNAMSFQMNDAQYNAYKAWNRARGTKDATKAYYNLMRELDK